MLDYSSLLNAAQYRVVSSEPGSMLVVAGAGTGKTRTIVYRLAWLVEHGVLPWNILLLTFTRKAAREMLDRAAGLLDGDLRGIQGGTFHAFAYRILREYKPDWLGERPFTVLDATDQQDIIKRVKDKTGIARGIRGFPKTPALMGYLSKARNKEMPLRDVIGGEAPQMLCYMDEIEGLQKGYVQAKIENGLMDYDDLLFEFEDLLCSDSAALASIRDRCRHILVDEYQDTNLVQARLVSLLAGETGGDRSIMAVGDEAQSIYAFRGATVRNIMDFPEQFPGTRVVALEENYRSVQPVLDVANEIMRQAEESYAKRLVTHRQDSAARVRIVHCSTDAVQGRCVARRIADLLEDGCRASEIAVLFRVGYHSYHVEAELGALHIPFKKYGGLRYQEAAHVKDFLACVHLIINPADSQSFARVAGMHAGVGPKTADKIFQAVRGGDSTTVKRLAVRYGALFNELAALTALRSQPDREVREVLDEVMNLYQPHLEMLYAEDYPQRLHSLQEIMGMASDAESLDLFLAELVLDSVDKEEETDTVTLSTVHSAKGLEWDNVMVIDLVDGRFPSGWAAFRKEAMEEERRLMYVACTRARNSLELYTYRVSTGYQHDCCEPSRFVREVSELPAVQRCVGDSTGRILVRGAHRRQMPQGSFTIEAPAAQEPPRPPAPEGGKTLVRAADCLDAIRAGRITACRHRIFGEGVIRAVDGDKLVVDFPFMGQKTILATYIFVQR